jgi:ABC-2 type transport system permease protein
MIRTILRSIWVIAYRDLLRFVAERSRLVGSLAMPFMFLIVFGAGLNQVIGGLAPGVDYIQFLYPGILAMTVLMNSLMSGLSIVWDREFGFLKEVLVAPLNRTGIVLGKAVGTALICLGQACIMLILAPVIGVKLDILLVLKLIPLLVLISLSLSSLGILIASRMRSQQGFQMLTQIAIMPLIFLSGVFFKVNNVPGWLAVISKINPLTYGVDAIRQVFLSVNIASSSGETTAPTSMTGVILFGHSMTVLEDALVIAVLGSILLALAIWSFNKQQ